MIPKSKKGAQEVWYVITIVLGIIFLILISGNGQKIYAYVRNVTTTVSSCSGMGWTNGKCVEPSVAASCKMSISGLGCKGSKSVCCFEEGSSGTGGKGSGPISCMIAAGQWTVVSNELCMSDYQSCLLIITKPEFTQEYGDKFSQFNCNDEMEGVDNPCVETKLPWTVFGQAKSDTVVKCYQTMEECETAKTNGKCSRCESNQPDCK